MKRITFAAVFVFGLPSCGPIPGSVDASPKTAEEDAPPGVAAVLSCRAGAPEPALAPIVAAPAREVATSAQMSDEAARAKRLFDQERWIDAVPALARVADGTTGDDRGNQELATYLQAVALVRSDKTTQALAIFQHIAADKAHLKWPETLLWLARLLEKPETAGGALSAIAAYGHDDVKRFDNAQQRDLYAILELALGRIAYLSGDYPAARVRFESVAATSPWHREARGCLEMITARGG